MNQSRWKGILVPIKIYFVASLLCDLITAISSKEHNADSGYDFIEHYFCALSWILTSAVFTFLYFEKAAPDTLKNSFSPRWLLLLPLAGVLPFFRLRDADASTHKASATYGILLLLSQLYQLIPWPAFEEPFKSYVRPDMTEHLLRFVPATLLFAAERVLWIVFVFAGSRHAVEETNTAPETEAYKLIYLRQLAAGAGPKGAAKWIVLIIGGFVLALLPLTKANLYIASPEEMMKSLSQDELCLELWSLLALMAGSISLIVFIFHTWKGLRALNPLEEKSSAMVVLGWFIPFYSVYWYVAAFTGWRKPFENGKTKLQLETEPVDRRILILAGCTCLLYFLQPLFELFYLFFNRLMTTGMNSGTILHSIIYPLYHLFFSAETVNLLFATGFSAFILYVVSLYRDLGAAASKKLQTHQ